MKTLLLGLAVISLLTSNMFAGPENLMQRAKNLGQKINARDEHALQSTSPDQDNPAQTTARPVRSAVPVPEAPAPRVTSRDQSIASLKADISAGAMRQEATSEMKQQFAKDLYIASQGSTHPTMATLTKFSDNLLTSLAGKQLKSADVERIVQKILIALNSAGLSSDRTQEIADEFKASVVRVGATDDTAATLADNLKTVAGEVQNGVDQ